MSGRDVVKVFQCGVVEWSNKEKKSSHKLLFAAGGKQINVFIRLKSQTMKKWVKQIKLFNVCNKCINQTALDPISKELSIFCADLLLTDLLEARMLKKTPNQIWKHKKIAQNLEAFCTNWALFHGLPTIWLGSGSLWFFLLCCHCAWWDPHGRWCS